MWLSTLFIWGCLFAFSACDSCPEPEGAASWLKLKPLGNCEDEENFCPYRITLPPLSIQLPKPFRELEKMAKELQNLKEVVNQLKMECQECKDRKRVERGGWKDHGEDEKRRTQRYNTSSTERHNPNAEQMVRIVISTPPQDDIKEINHSSLEWDNDRMSDADQVTIDQSSEMSREVKIFDPSLEETPEDIYEVKQTFSPTTEEIHRERMIQPGEFFESTIPRRKDIVQSVTDGSEMSREVKIFNPSLGEIPDEISDEKQVFSPTTEERQGERTFQEGELLEFSIPRMKNFVQSSTHGKQHPNLYRERNVKNISGILTARRRVQNLANTNGLNSNSGDANTKTVDLSISAGSRRIVNFSRAGGPLRPKTFVNNRAKVSDEDRLRNPAAVRMHSQGGDRTVKTGLIGTGFSPVRSGVMRIKETSPHIINSKLGTNNGLTLLNHDEKITTKPGTNIVITPSNEDEKMAIINPKPGTNIRLTPSADEKMTIITPKLGTNSRLNPSSEDENIAMVNPNPGTNIRLTLLTDEENMAIINPNHGIKSGQSISTEDEKLSIPGINIHKPMPPIIINPQLRTNSGLNPSIEDKNMAKINPNPITNSRLTPSTDNGKTSITNLKPETNSRLTSSTDDGKTTTKPNSGLTTTTEDENMAKINPNTGIKIGQIKSTEDRKLTITSTKPVTNSRLTPSTDERMTIINPKLGTDSELNPSIEGENIANPKLGTNSRLTLSIDDENLAKIHLNPINNSRLTPSTDDEKTTITNPKPGTNSRLSSSTDDKKMTINPKLGTNSRQTLSTYETKMTTTKPGTNSRLTPLTYAEKMANKEYTNTKSDLRTDSKNDLEDARQVTVDEEENFKKLNKTVITKVPTNMRTEDRGDVSHTVQTTNKSIFSVMNRAEQPNLIKLENEHMGRNASLVTSSTAGIGPSAGKADSTFSGRKVNEKNDLIKKTETGYGQEDLGSTILETSNERETNPLTSDHKNETQLGTFIEKANEEKTTGSVKKDLLRNLRVTQLETDMVNPTHVPSVKITSADRKVSTAGKIESPVAGQVTRIVKSSFISHPVKLKGDVENIQSINSKKNISKIREVSNVRFGKNITRVMPKLPIRPGRHPTTVNPSGGPKLHMINKGNSSVVLPSNSSISGRNSNLGRRNSSVMVKPIYVRRRPSFQTEPNTNRGFKANVSAVTHFMTPTGEISTDHTEELKVNTQAMGVIDKNTSTGSKSLQDPVGGHSSESALTLKVVSGTKNSDIEDSLHTGASDSLTGGKSSKQFGLETTDQNPMEVDSMKSLLNPQNPEITSSTQSSSINEKTQPTTSNNAKVIFTVMDHEESAKHIPAVTNKHEDMVKNISQDTALTPVSFENTVATRELELIELNEDKLQKYSGDVLSNPNSVSDVQGNNGERYTIPVVLETLANVEEIKGSKVFSLSPEDTADGFKTIAVRDEVTQKEQAENKIQSTCVDDCTPTQQPTTQSRPSFESERGRGPPQDCADYITKARKNGVYKVTPRSKNSTFHVSCDMETSGGGWTLIQQRFNGNISFNRTWEEYKRGFGKLMGEFWLGNDKMHWLTQAKNMSLRIELEDFEGVREYAHYDHFHVANESQQYRLSIGGYSGTAGNAMQFNKKYNHDQKLFTTPDRDNDLYPSGNCGAYYSSGWWFDACMSANLNGKYYHTKYKGVRNGIFWGTWHNITMEYYPTNERQSFKTVRMMIRPQNYAN